MKIYQVGGSVRDMLMGREPKDIDFVVVGSSEEEMIALGYERISNSFPVFTDNVHEYALARIEKKVSSGHTGFETKTDGVALIEDLKRRDLTINAMALDHDGNIVDPFGGRDDLENKILRHTSEAFSEDPLRVFRIARFASRYPDFSIHTDTLQIMKDVTKSDDFKLISPERVFKEMRSALNEKLPSRFFEVLKEAGGIEFYFPELFNLYDVPQNPKYHPEGDCWVHTMLVVDQASKITRNEKVIFAALVHDLGKGITPKEILPAHHGHEESGVALVEEFCKRLRVPLDMLETAVIMTRNHLKVHQLKTLKPSTIVRMLHDIDAYRRPHLVTELIQGCMADEMGKYKSEADSQSPLEEYLEVTAKIGFKDCRPGLKGEAIKNEIRNLRVTALKNYINGKGFNYDKVG